MGRALSLTSSLAWALLLGAFSAASCDHRGVTSTCPPLPRYQSYPLGDASPPDAASADGGEAQAALAAAVDAGCATAPTHFPDDGEAGASGAAGEGGSGGESSLGTGGTAFDQSGAAGGR